MLISLLSSMSSLSLSLVLLCRCHTTSLCTHSMQSYLCSLSLSRSLHSLFSSTLTMFAPSYVCLTIYILLLIYLAACLLTLVHFKHLSYLSGSISGGVGCSTGTLDLDQQLHLYRPTGISVSSSVI